MGLPGWNSIQATGILSNFFFYASIGALVLLGLAEVFSHHYGGRHDVLVAQQRQAEKDATDGEIARLHRDTAEANKKAAEAQLELAKFKAPRMLNPEQQLRIADKLKTFSGTVWDAAVGPQGDPEPIYLLRAIHAALVNAGWHQSPWPSAERTYTDAPMLPVGMASVTNVIIDADPSRWDHFKPAAIALADALKAEGIDAMAQLYKSSHSNIGVLHVRIGRKL